MPAVPPYRDPSLPERFLRWLEEVRDILRPIPRFYENDGSPEGVQAAERGSRYFRTDAGGVDPWLYVKTTTIGNTGWEPYGGAAIAGLGIWRYRTAVDATPAAGRLQFDDVDIDAATNLYVNVTNDGGTDMTAFLNTLATGDLLYIQVRANSSQRVICEIGVPALAAGVFTFPLTNVEGEGTAPTNNTQVALVSG